MIQTKRLDLFAGIPIADDAAALSGVFLKSRLGNRRTQLE